MRAVRRKVVVVGEGALARAALAVLRRREDVDVEGGEAALAGARVVVLAGAPAPLRLAAAAPGAVVVVAGHGPQVDACLDATLLPRPQVLGTGGVAASTRWRALVAAAAQVNARDVSGLVLGGEGRHAVAAASLATVAGAPATTLLDDAVLAGLASAAVADTDDEHDGAAAIAEVVAAVLDDSRRVLPCALRCRGEFGVDGRAVAVPVVVGAGGAEAVLELVLGEHEHLALASAAEAGGAAPGP